MRLQRIPVLCGLFIFYEKLLKKPLDIQTQICYFIMRVECPETAGTVRCKLRTPAEEHTKLK
jgi:hypothetical protein